MTEPAPLPITAWALTTGEVGMRTQARGLASAVARTVVEKTAPPDWWGRLRGAREAGDRLVAPWPDLLVTCGRRSVRHAAAIRAASGGRTVTVHIQDPLRGYGAFDLILAMAHDPVPAGPKVMKCVTALHDITPQALAAGAAAWRARFAGLGAPLVGVLIGGTRRRQVFTVARGRALLEGLNRLRAATGAGLAITPSRRTPAPVRDLFAAAYADDPRVFLWDLAGDNPYRGILALSDHLVVTGDSVSMMSEAMATRATVDVFDLGFGRYRRFLDDLVAAGRIRRFTGAAPLPGPAIPIDATAAAAAAVRRLVQARTGMVG